MRWRENAQTATFSSMLLLSMSSLIIRSPSDRPLPRPASGGARGPVRAELGVVPAGRLGRAARPGRRWHQAARQRVAAQGDELRPDGPGGGRAGRRDPAGCARSPTVCWPRPRRSTLRRTSSTARRTAATSYPQNCRTARRGLRFCARPKRPWRPRLRRPRRRGGRRCALKAASPARPRTDVILQAQAQGAAQLHRP